MSSRKVAVYTIAYGKEDLARKSLRTLHKFAGIQFDHFVFAQQPSDDFREWLEQQEAVGSIKWLRISKKNYGQQIAANIMIDEMGKAEVPYNWIMRWDPDAIAHTRRFLRKMIRFGEAVMRQGELPILSPNITKLKFPPPAIWVNELPRLGKFEIVQILGGICRLHPAVFFDNWRFNPFLPVSLGEAAEVSDRVTELAHKNRPWVTLRLPGLTVEHAFGADVQEMMYPEMRGMEREIARCCSYGY